MLEMNEKLRFSTPFEKTIHKQISKMKFGECLTIEAVVKTDQDKKAITKAIEKSAKYNCMSVSFNWSKTNDSVKVTHKI